MVLIICSDLEFCYGGVSGVNDVGKYIVFGIGDCECVERGCVIFGFVFN